MHYPDASVPRLFFSGLLRALPVLAFLAIGAGLHGQTIITLTTAAGDGGFDGWIQRSGTSSSTSETLTIGNPGNANQQRVALLMFDISDSLALSADDIVAVTLSFQVTQGNGTSEVAVQHGAIKAETGLHTGVWTSTLNGSGWADQSATVSGVGVKTFDVTSWFLSDLAAAQIGENEGVAWSSFRLVVPSSYGAAANTAVWQTTIASSENTTTGILIPTLTITVVPEPASASVLAGSVALSVMMACARGRRRR